MAKIQTFDEHIKEWFKPWFKLSHKATDPREGGFYELMLENNRRPLYAPVSLDDLALAVNSIRELQNSSAEMDEKSIAGILSKCKALQESYKSTKYDWCVKQNLDYILKRIEREKAGIVYRCCGEEGKLTDYDISKAKNTAIANALISEVLGLTDNYSIWILGKDESTFDNLAESAQKRFTPAEKYKIGMPIRCKPYEGKDGRIMSIDKLGDMGNVNGHGTGSIAILDEWPQNKLLARWHGGGIGAADFVLKLADIVKEIGYSAHFDFLQHPSNGVIGTFYDPDWRSNIK